MPDRLPAPLDAAREVEVQELLRRSLEHLSPREREVFVLRDLQGATSPETALALGIGESTVRSLLTLARKRLRRLLGHRAPSLATEGGEEPTR